MLSAGQESVIVYSSFCMIKYISNLDIRHSKMFLCCLIAATEYNTQIFVPGSKLLVQLSKEDEIEQGN